jgi:hypothetical protein
MVVRLWWPSLGTHLFRQEQGEESGPDQGYYRYSSPGEKPVAISSRGQAVNISATQDIITALQFKLKLKFKAKNTKMHSEKISFIFTIF